MIFQQFVPMWSKEQDKSSDIDQKLHFGDRK